MGHRFKVYDVGPDGSRLERDVIEVATLPTFDIYNRCRDRLVVDEVCKLFKSHAAPNGFTEMTNYWLARKPTSAPNKEGDIEIYYSCDNETVFFLERVG